MNSMNHQFTLDAFSTIHHPIYLLVFVLVLYLK